MQISRNLLNGPQGNN